MPILPPGADLFGAVPALFASPFPSNSGNLEKFRQLSGDAGVFSSQQARAWEDITQMAMKAIATSSIVGGLRKSMMDKLVSVDAGIAGDVVHGIFGRAEFPASTNPKDLGMAALQVGLNVAVDLISAVPIWGQVAAAAIQIGKWFWKLAHSEPEQQELIVPWQEYSRDTDEDFVNQLLLPGLVPTVDWTPFWAPPLDTAGGWKIAKTKKGGDTRSWGPFAESGSLHYAGYGMMPGTQRIADIVQAAPLSRGPTWRNDAITNVGDYYPAMSQWGTAAWGWVNQMDGLGMFNLKSRELADAWAQYFGSFFEDGFDALAHQSDKSGLDALYIAKALLKFTVVKATGTPAQLGVADDFLMQGANLGSYVSPEMWKRNPFAPRSRLLQPFDAIIGPALERLRKRQWVALSNTLACAYVRPEPVDGKPAHAAFLDRGAPTDPSFDSYGEQLAARCRKMREILLTHDARFEVDIDDARNADPAYAEQLAASKGLVGAGKLRAGPVRLEQHVPQAPDATKPQGGGPFGGADGTGGGGTKKRSRGMSTGTKVVLVGGAIGGAVVAYRRFSKRRAA